MLHPAAARGKNPRDRLQNSLPSEVEAECADAAHSCNPTPPELLLLLLLLLPLLLLLLLSVREVPRQQLVFAGAALEELVSSVWVFMQQGSMKDKRHPYQAPLLQP